MGFNAAILRRRRRAGGGSGLSISAPSAVLFADGDQPYAMGVVWPPANTVLYIDFDNDIYYWDGAYKSLGDLTDNGDGTYDVNLSTSLDVGNLAGFVEVTNDAAPTTSGVALDAYDSATGLKRFEVFMDGSSGNGGFVQIYDSGTSSFSTANSENNTIASYLGQRIRSAWSYTAGSPRLVVQNNSTAETNTNAAAITGCDRIGIGYRRHYDDSPLAGSVNKVCLIDATLTVAELRDIIEYSDRTYGDFWMGDSFLAAGQVRTDLIDIRGTSTYYFSGQSSTGGWTLAQQATDYTTNQSRHYDKTLVICDGLEYTADPTGATSIAAIANMVAQLSHDRWVYVQSNPQEATGTGNRADFDSCDAAIRAYCGEAHYCETLPQLQAENDGSSQDLTDVANDIWPSSLRSDTVHLNAAGNDVMAQIIYSHIAAQGWLTRPTDYIQFADSQYDSGDDAYTATIVSSDSLLDFAVATSTPPTVTGDASDSVTLEGTLAAINTALRGPTIDNKAVGAGTLVATITHDATGRTASKTISVTSVQTIAAQSFEFGALTREGAGAVTVVSTADTPSFSITAGNASGHWAINSSTGSLAPSATGVGNLTGTYNLTVSDGSDSNTITITLNAGEFSAVSRAEIIAAIAAAETADNTATYIVSVRDGSVITGAGANDTLDLFGYEFAGTLADDNDGASEAAYDYDATASFTGGSVTITPETPLGASIDCCVYILGSTGIVLKDFEFTNVADGASYNLDDGGANTDTSEATALKAHQLYISNSGTYTANPSVILTGNAFGCRATNSDPQYWGRSIFCDKTEDLVIEDCTFDGFYSGLVAQSVRRTAVRRNEAQNQLRDFLFFGAALTADLSSFTSQRIEASSNIIWNQNASEDFAGEHSDGIQIGAASDQVNKSLLIKKNYIHLMAAENVNAYSKGRVSQGIFMDGGTVERNGVVAENFILCTVAAHGITSEANSSGLEIRNNTIVPDLSQNRTLAGAVISSDGPIINMNAGDAGMLIKDNISFGVTAGLSVAHDNCISDRDFNSGTALSLFDLLDGPFTDGTYGPTPTTPVRTDTAANLVTDIDTYYAPKTGSLAETRGHTNTEKDRTPTALSFTDLTDQTLSTVVYAVQQVTGIDDNTFVSISTSDGVEWGTHSTNNPASVTNWGSSDGVIDNNEYLHLRVTTSDTNEVEQTATVTVGDTSDTWSVTTVALATDPELTFIGSHTLASADPATVSAASIGAADTNRRVVVAFACRGNNTSITSVSIGGSAAISVHEVEATGTRWVAGVFYRDIPTGATADIVIDWSATPFVDAMVAVFTVDKTLVGTPIVAGGANASATSISGSLANIPAGSCGIAIGGANTNPAGFAQTLEDAVWTEVVDGVFSSERIVCDMANGMSADTSSDVQWAHTGTAAEMGYIAVAFPPA